MTTSIFDLSTDKLDYAPGDTAIVTLTGVDIGSTVEFQVLHVSDQGADGLYGTLDDTLDAGPDGQTGTADDGYGTTGAGHVPFTVTDGVRTAGADGILGNADDGGDLDGIANGEIVTSWYVNPDDSANETFLLTATDSTSGTVATTSFTDTGGAYTLNFSAADPSIYLPPIPFPADLTAPTGRGDGDPLIPLAEFNDGSTDVRVESLAPQDMALGQIVPFETKITVSGNTTPENGVITFVIGWNTLTTNSGDFGYDARGDDVGYGVIGAFIDTGDGAYTDTNDDATVDSFTWSLINDEIVGVFTVSGLDDGDEVVFESWLVLDDTIPAGIGGNVQSRLIDAATGSDQSITVANSGTISLDNGDSISTGNQTVPLLKPSDFFTAEVDLSVIKSDNQDDPLVITAGDDPVTGTEYGVIQGQTLTYTIQVANAGPAVANSVVVYDELDPNVTFVSASGGGFINSDTGDTIPDGAVQWDVGALAPGDSVEFTVTVTVNEDAPTGSSTGEDLVNTVTVTTISDDTNLLNNTNTEPTAVIPAIQVTDLQVTKTVTSITNPDLSDGGSTVDQAGDVINYTITLDNLASFGSLTGITVNDPLLGTLSGPSGDTDTDSELDPDEIWTYTGSYTVTQADIDSNGTLEPDNDQAGFIDNVVTGDSNETNPDTASASVPLEQNPLMSITKVATAIDGVAITGDTATDPVIDEAGDVVTYQIVVTNTGNETLTNVDVTDPLTGQSDTITSLDPGASTSFTTTYTVTQADIDNNGGGDGDIDNAATASDDRAPDVTATEEVPLEQNPLMSITKVATAIDGVAITGDTATDPVIDEAGDVVTYQIVVTNTGNETLTNVDVTDPLTGQSDTITSLDPGASTSFTTTYTVTQADIDNNGGGDGDIDNAATASDDRAPDVTATEEVPLEQNPLMSITKVATAIDGVAITGDTATDPVIDEAGDVVTYQIVVTNTGNETLTNVDVTDPLTGQSDTITSLDPGASTSFTTTYTVTQADIDNNGGGDGDIDNAATASDDRAPDVTATEEVPLEQNPLMSITKVATAIDGVAITGDTATDPVIDEAGDVVTYQIVVTNTGNETLTNVDVTDPLTGQSDTITSLDPGASTSFTTTYTVTQADIDNNGGGDGDIDNAATASDDRAPDVTATEEVPLEQNPLMSITKVATAIDGVAITGDTATDPVIDEAGDVVTYQIVVTNTGNETLTNVDVTDPLTGQSDTITSLDPGASTSFTTTYTVTQADIDNNGGGDGDIDNAATASDDRAPDVTATEEVPLEQNPLMSITKVATAIDGVAITGDTATDPVIDEAGDVVTYQIVVTNTGNETLTNVDVTDPLTGQSDTITSLDPGASTSFTTTYTVTQADIDNNGGGDGDIDNAATASDDRAPDVTATEEVPLEQNPLMSITKVATAIDGVAITGDTATDPVIDEAGDVVTYQIVVTNTGNETLTNVDVTDPLTGQSDTITSLDPGASTSFTTTYTVTQADIDNNGGGDGDIDNAATASDDRAPDVTATEEVPLEQNPLMSITKVATAIDGVAITGDTATDPVIDEAGDVVTYQIVVTNTGNETLTNVDVTDPLTGQSDTITSLDPGASTSFTTTYTVTQADIDNNGGGDGDIDNAATASDDRAPDVTATEEVPLEQNPLMSITKVATAIDGVAITGDTATDPVIDEAGDVVTYQIVVTNTGNETLTNVDVTDPLTGQSDTITSLDPGASTSFTTTYTVTQADIDNNGGGDGDIDNAATASDDRAPDVTATEEVPLEQNPLMSITKVATAIDGVAITGDTATDPVIDEAGDVVTYQIVVTNTGNETLTNVDVTDPLTGQSDTITSLDPGASTSFTTTYTVTQADIDNNGGGDGDIDNAATASDDRAPDVTATEEVPLEQNPLMSITKVATAIDGVAITGDTATDPVIDEAGDVVTYQIVVTNTGNETLTNVDVTDPLTGQSDTITSLDPGASTSFTTTYTVTQADIDNNGGGDGDIDNAATASDDRAPDVTATEEVPLEQNPLMSITKVATAIDGVAITGDTATDPVIDEAGDVVTYQIVVTNTGNETLTNVDVTDPLTGQSDTITSLDPGASTSFTTTYTVTQADIDNNGGGDGDIDNAATASDDRAPDVTATEEVPLEQNPLMSITKVATAIDGVAITGDTATDPVIDEAGDVVTYQIVVTNTGNETLTNVDVTDPLTGQSDTITSLDPGASTSFTTTYTVTQADIDNNGGGDGDIDNAATASDDRAPDVTATEEVPLEQNPLMSITKVATAIDGVAITGDTATDPVIDEAGDVVTYQIVVTNTGNETLTNVDVTDPLTGQSDTITSLDPGASTSFTTTYTVTQADIDNNGGGDGDIDNAATASDDRAPDVTATEEVPLEQNPLMSITKVATAIDGVAITGDTATDPVIDEAGDVVTYQIVVTNTGNETLTNVDVTDPLTGQSDTITSLDPGASTSFTTTYTVTQADIDNNGGGDGDIDNAATASDDRAPDVTATEEVPLEQNPLMSITKVATAIDGVAITGDTATDPVIDEAGDVVTYQIVVTNTGNETLTNVDVTDPLTGQSDTITSLDPGASTSFTTTYTVTQADIDNNGGGDGDIDNAATASDDRAPDVTATEEVPLEQNPSIDIDKITGDGTTNGDGLLILAGSDIVWTYTVTNPGNVTLENVTVTDDNGTPSNPSDDFLATFVSGDTNNNDKLDLSETWVFSANGTAQAGDYTNIGTAEGDYSEGTVTDEDPSGYTGVVPGVDINIDVKKEVSVDGGNNWVDANDPTGPSLIEGTVDPQFRFTVKNTGTEDLSNVTLSDSDFNIDTTNGDNTIEIGTLEANDNQPDGDDEYVLIYTGAQWEFGQHTDTATARGEFTDDLGGTYNPEDMDDANYLGISAAGQITPTNTTCDMYINGTAMDFEDYYADQGGDIQYNAKKNGDIISVNPGVFFYYTGLSNALAADEGEMLDVYIDQENDNDLFPLFNVNEDGVKLYAVFDANENGMIDLGEECHQVQLSDDQVTYSDESFEVDAGDVLINYTPTDDGFLYVVGVKYETDSPVGTNIPKSAADKDANYSFQTVVDGTAAETALGGVDLSPKFAGGKGGGKNKLTLDGTPTTDGEVLTEAALAKVVDAAIDYWTGQGIDFANLQKLLNTDVRIEDLGGDLLGQTTGVVVRIDDDAAGYGWSDSLDAVDADEIDLLSALTHEFGHVLGYSHDDMGATLSVGERELPLDDAGDTAQSDIDNDLLFG